MNLNLTQLRIKDISQELNISRGTASKYYKDMISQYETPILTFEHLYDYFKIPVRN